MRIMGLQAVAFSMALAGAANAAPGRDDTQNDAQAFRALMACRDIQAPSDRLQCYDTQSQALASATQAGKLIVADETQIKQAKRDLFGFGSVRIPFLSDKSGEETTQIEATVTNVRQIGYGKWEFILNNGMRWRQTDDEQIFPRTGENVTIKTGAMGSYWLRMKSKAIRVMREK